MLVNVDDLGRVVITKPLRLQMGLMVPNAVYISISKEANTIMISKRYIPKAKCIKVTHGGVITIPKDIRDYLTIEDTVIAEVLETKVLCMSVPPGAVTE